MNYKPALPAMWVGSFCCCCWLWWWWWRGRRTTIDMFQKYSSSFRMHYRRQYSLLPDRGYMKITRHLPLLSLPPIPHTFLHHPSTILLTSLSLLSPCWGPPISSSSPSNHPMCWKLSSLLGRTPPSQPLGRRDQPLQITKYGVFLQSSSTDLERTSVSSD